MHVKFFVETLWHNCVRWSQFAHSKMTNLKATICIEHLKNGLIFQNAINVKALYGLLLLRWLLFLKRNLLVKTCKTQYR